MDNKAQNSDLLDRIDTQILDILSREGRLAVTEIARRIGTSKTPCQTRLKRLQDKKFILGFRACLLYTSPSPRD